MFDEERQKCSPLHVKAPLPRRPGGEVELFCFRYVFKLGILGGCYPPQPENTLLNLLTFSYPTQPHSLIAKYANAIQLI